MSRGPFPERLSSSPPRSTSTSSPLSQLLSLPVMRRPGHGHHVLFKKARGECRRHGRQLSNSVEGSRYVPTKSMTEEERIFVLFKNALWDIFSWVGLRRGRGEGSPLCADYYYAESRSPFPCEANAAAGGRDEELGGEEQWRQNGGENMQLSCWGPHHCV